MGDNRLKPYGFDCGLITISVQWTDIGQKKRFLSTIDTLIDFVFDIIKVKKTQNQYFIENRHFEMPEVKLLIDAVQSSRFITNRKSKELINKLSAFVAPNQVSALKRHLYVDSRNKSNNEAIYIISDAIQTAIIEKKKYFFNTLITVCKESKSSGMGEHYIVFHRMISYGVTILIIWPDFMREKVL